MTLPRFCRLTRRRLASHETKSTNCACLNASKSPKLWPGASATQNTEYRSHRPSSSKRGGLTRSILCRPIERRWKSSSEMSHLFNPVISASTSAWYTLARTHLRRDRRDCDFGKQIALPSPAKLRFAKGSALPPAGLAKANQHIR
jgi:hypothetical protein